MCCKIAQSYSAVADSIGESSSDDDDEKSVPKITTDEELSVRFSNAVSNLFRSSQFFNNEKKTLRVAHEEYTSTEEMDVFGSRQAFDNEKMSRVEAEKNSSKGEMGLFESTRVFDNDHKIFSVDPAKEAAFEEVDLSSKRQVYVSTLQHTSYAYNKMMKAFTRAGKVNEVVRLFREMKSSKCKPNVHCYNTVMNALAMANRVLETRVVFKEIMTSGLAPVVSSYNILVKLYCRLDKLGMAYKVIECMLKCGCKPDSATYSTLIAGLCWVGRIEEAWRVVDQMLENECLPIVHTYTPIVQGYCLDGRSEEAENLMGIMENAGCPPSWMTYNVLIGGLCKTGNFDAVEKIIRESEAKGWKPNADTYNAYMNGLSKWGKHKEAIELLEVMQRNGLEPNDLSLNIHIDCLCCDSRFSEAMCLLDSSSELKWLVGVAGYNIVMSRVSEIASWLEVLNLFTNMLKKGIAPNARTFNIVINSLCKGGKLQKAKCVFNSRKFIANRVTYHTLIYWCFQNKDAKEAQHLFSMMNVEEIAPNAITYNIMVVGLCFTEKFSEATNCALQSVRENFDVDRVTGLISKLHERKRFEELRHLFEGMKTYFFEGSCQSIEIFNICVILGKILGKQ